MQKVVAFSECMNFTCLVHGKFKKTTICILSGLAGTTTIAPTTIAPVTLAPTIGQTNFCTSEQPCSKNSGDCNSNDDCQADTKCGSNNCPSFQGFPFWVDCCYAGEINSQRIKIT